MANTAKGGLRWAKNRNGSNKEPIERGIVASAYGTGIFRGDPVKRVSDGTFAAAAATDALIVGICCGVERYKNSSGQVVTGNFLPTSTSYSGSANLENPQASVILYNPIAGQLFEIDMNTASTVADVQTQIGNNIDTSAGAGGSTISGRSTYVGDNASPGTGTAQLRIHEVVQSADNDVTSVNWKALVEINESTDVNFTTTGV